MKDRVNRVAIIGTGAVGSSYVFALIKSRGNRRNCLN